MNPWLVTLLAALLFAPPLAGAEIYKWKDARGKIHFGNVPPPTGAIDIESRGQEAEPPPAADSLEGGEDRGGTPGGPSDPVPGTSGAGATDEAFSTQVSSERHMLKRELAPAKREAQAAAAALDEARKRDAEPTPALERDRVLTRVIGLDPRVRTAAGPPMEELERRKQAADAQLEGIRARWSTLEVEARERNRGSLPQWWIALER